MTNELWEKVHVRRVAIRQEMERYPERDILPAPEPIEITKARILKRWAEARATSSN